MPVTIFNYRRGCTDRVLKIALNACIGLMHLFKAGNMAQSTEKHRQTECEDRQTEKR